MRMRPIHIVPVLVLATLVSAKESFAEPPGATPTPAEALFREGRAALERGDNATACAKFRESLALASRPSTLLNLAQCEEHEGRWLDAAEHWRRGIASLPPGDERIAVSEERARALQKRIPRIVVKTAGRLPSGARVSVDGAGAVPPESVGERRVDPGHHTVTLTSPGEPDQTTSVELSENETNTVTLSSTGMQSSNGGTSPHGGMAPVRIAGIVTLGVAVVGVGVAAVTGGVLVAKNASIQRECPNKLCTPAGRQLIDSTAGLKVANAVAWGAAAATAVTGVVLVVVGQPKAQEKGVSAWVTPIDSGAAWGIRGSF